MQASASCLRLPMWHLRRRLMEDLAEEESVPKRALLTARRTRRQFRYYAWCLLRVQAADTV